jgi:hypothetical protein
MNIPVVYVAGPFRGSSYWKQEQNIRSAEEIALAIWQAGAACICPHTNTRFFQGAAPDALWLTGDIEILRRCDAVVTTPDWKTSTGACAEVKVAQDIGIPVLHSVEDLCQWMRDLYAP